MKTNQRIPIEGKQDKIEDFISKCLQQNPENRPTWDSILQHPIYTGRFTEKIPKKEPQQQTNPRIERVYYPEAPDVLKEPPLTLENWVGSCILLLLLLWVLFILT